VQSIGLGAYPAKAVSMRAGQPGMEAPEMSAEASTIETAIPARLDRLPWSRFHWLIVIGLGTVWILDGLEVTMVGSVATELTTKGSGIAITVGQIGVAAAAYVAGACLGALVFGQLTDRFGRKKLFLVTLGVYILATVATAFSFDAWYFYAARFFTGAGIGGEYAAINSAIDELIPARVRGRVDLMINGSYWVGAMAGSAAAIVFLSSFAPDLGWRLCFGVGAVLGLAIMLVRRSVPESPRWLFIHGREEEAEAIVSRIERDVTRETGQRLDEPDGTIEVRQREVIPFTEIAKTGFGRYPRRAILGIALFVGQAFIYNGITFDLGTLFSTFFKVSASFVPVFLIIYAAGNFLGPLVLGRLFDTVGRKPMITITYIGSAIVAVIMAVLFERGSLTSEWWFEVFVVATFFLASAGASAAYLTVSEIFPMETRALAIAFFYAIGTAVGGITGPLIFGHLIASGSRSEVAIGFYIGAAVMAVGGVAEILFGVRAEQQQLEDIATPITAEDAEQGEGGEEATDEQKEERRRASERDRRMRERGMRRAEWERTGVRRFRPGPGGALYAPRMAGTGTIAENPAALERQIEVIERTLDHEGPVQRRRLAELVGARYWGPGRFSLALQEAVREGRARRLSGGVIAPVQR
jgi:MFS family permease